MRFGVLFPNEASFYHKMGAEIFENYPSAQELYRKASKAAQLDMKTSLIYEQKPLAWDETERAIAVLLTSVAFYQAWQECYQLKPTVLLGSGVGILSALVCAKTISVQAAVRMIRSKSLRLPRFSQPDGSVFACSSAERIYNAAAVRSLHHDFQKDAEAVVKCAQDERLDCIIEIGPNCCMTEILRSMNCDTRFVAPDDPNDNAVILENLEYKKYFNYLYGARRMLGIATATQSFADGNEEETAAAFAAIKAFTDEALKKQYTGQSVRIGDYDLQLCAKELAAILRNKKVPKEEIVQRLRLLEQEIALPVLPYFAQWL